MEVRLLVRGLSPNAERTRGLTCLVSPGGPVCNALRSSTRFRAGQERRTLASRLAGLPSCGTPSCATPGDPEQVLRFAWRRYAPPAPLDQVYHLLDELYVGRLSLAGIVLQSDPRVTAAFECVLGKTAPDQVSPENRHRPVKSGSLQHRQVRIQARSRRWKPERQSLATEIQLDDRPWWQRTGVVEGERNAQKAGVAPRSSSQPG